MKKNNDLKKQSSNLMICMSIIVFLFALGYFGINNTKGTYSAYTYTCANSNYKLISGTGKCCLSGFTDYDSSNNKCVSQYGSTVDPVDAVLADGSSTSGASCKTSAPIAYVGSGNVLIRVTEGTASECCPYEWSTNGDTLCVKTIDTNTFSYTYSTSGGVSCADGFSLVNGKCTQCKTGYTLDSTGDCISSNGNQNQGNKDQSEDCSYSKPYVISGKVYTEIGVNEKHYQCCDSINWDYDSQQATYCNSTLGEGDTYYYHSAIPGVDCADGFSLVNGQCIQCKDDFVFDEDTNSCVNPNSGNPSSPGYTPSSPGYTPSNPGNTPSNPSDGNDDGNTGDNDVDENTDVNPPTGSIAIFLVWIMTLGTLVYAFWYFKKVRTQ